MTVDPRLSLERCRVGGWRQRWTAKFEVVPSVWVVGHGFTKRGAVRALRRRQAS